ncbi:hypothetical protein TNCV_1743951 [Trichonephila clavipes]|nr:hypothetical protein TNCV_1743951 [Trichonephila clavipes]
MLFPKRKTKTCFQTLVAGIDFARSIEIPSRYLFLPVFVLKPIKPPLGPIDEKQTNKKSPTVQEKRKSNLNKERQPSTEQSHRKPA